MRRPHRAANHLALLFLALLFTGCSTTAPEQRGGTNTALNTNTIAQPVTQPAAQTTTTRPLQAAPERATGVVQKSGTRWMLVYQGRRLCLPGGLFRQQGLTLTFDPRSIKPPRPNVRRACLLFDTSTIKLTNTPSGMNTLTLTVIKESASTLALQYTRRVARGPAAMGLSTHTVCWPDGLNATPGATVRLRGYPIKQRGASCEAWVFVERVR